MSKEGKELKIGLWLAHRKEKILFFGRLGLLIIFILFLGGIFLNLFKYLQSIKNPPQIKNFVKYQEFRERIKGEKIIVKESGFLLVDFQKKNYDLFAKIENPNRRWFAENLNYQFEDEQGKIVFQGATCLLPQEEKFIIKTNLTSNQPIKKINFNLTKISFKRIKNPALFPEIKFEIKEVRSEPGKPFRVYTRIKNKSIVNLEKVEIDLVLYQGKRVVALNQTFIEDFLADQEREVGFVWLQEIPSETRIEVIPIINKL